MLVRDPYGVLGVERGTSEKVRKAYGRLAGEHHPDANPGAEERFKETQHAYEVLSDPKKRREYDERSRPSSGRSRAGSWEGRIWPASPGSSAYPRIS